MLKLIRPLFICALLCSCNSHKYYERHQDVVFVFLDHIELDLNSKILSINFAQLHYKDTLTLSDDTTNEIVSSFENNKIGDVKGEVIYATNTHLVMPPSGLKIKTFYSKKLQSQMFVEYDYPTKILPPTTEENRVVNFRNSALKILDKNPKLEKAKKLLLKYEHDNKIFYL